MSERPRKILFVAPYPPSQIRVRTFQVIRALARDGHRVTLAALDDGFFPPAAREEMEQVCEAVHIVPHQGVRARLNALFALPTATPLWAAYCRSPRMAHLLPTLVQENQFDVAHIEHLRAAHFVENIKLPTVWDSVDCLTDLQTQMKTRGSVPERLLAWEEAAKLRKYEPRMVRKFARVAVTSWYDARAMEKLGAFAHPVAVVPNGVDLDYFRPDAGIIADPETIIFSGKMSYRANDDAARFLVDEILPRLRELRPHVRLTIAGNDPSPRLRALAERAGNVTVTGYVPDLRPLLSRATLSLCPMQMGVGIQNKVLEASAMARPVVCTPLAARALLPQATESGAVQVGENADELARLCARLLENPLRAAQAGRDARAYVEKYHDWETTARGFVHLYNEAIRAGRLPTKP